MRLADHPGLCSRCFLSKLDNPYVDFQVFWDGPVVPGAATDSFDALPSNPIDDLFLCHDCLVEAGNLIGLGDVVDLENQVAVLTDELVVLRRERLDAVKRLDTVETALTGRQKPAKARGSVASAKPKGNASV